VIARDRVYDANRLLLVFNKSEPAFILKFLLTAALANVVIFLWIRNKKMAETTRAFCFYCFSLQIVTFTFAGGLVGLAEKNSFTADSAPLLKKMAFVAITLFALAVIVYYLVVVPVRTIRQAELEQKISPSKKKQMYFFSYLTLLIIVLLRAAFSIQYFPNATADKSIVRFVSTNGNRIPSLNVGKKDNDRYQLSTHLVYINKNDETVFSDINKKAFYLKWVWYNDQNENGEIDEDEYKYNDSLSMVAENQGMEPLVFRPDEPASLRLAGMASLKDLEEIEQVLDNTQCHCLQLNMIDIDGVTHELYFDEIVLKEE
jgi:hypothetical protein